MGSPDQQNGAPGCQKLPKSTLQASKITAFGCMVVGIVHPKPRMNLDYQKMLPSQLGKDSSDDHPDFSTPLVKKSQNRQLFFLLAPGSPWDDNRIVCKHGVAHGRSWDDAGIVLVGIRLCRNSTGSLSPTPEDDGWDGGRIVLAKLQYGPRPGIMVGLYKVNGDRVLG